MKHSNLVYAQWILEKLPVFCDSSLMTIGWEFLDFLFKQKGTFFAQCFLKKKKTIIKASTTVYSLYGWFFVCSSSKYFWSIYVSMRTGDWKSAFCSSASHRLKNRLLMKTCCWLNICIVVTWSLHRATDSTCPNILLIFKQIRIFNVGFVTAVLLISDKFPCQ